MRLTGPCASRSPTSRTTSTTTSAAASVRSRGAIATRTKLRRRLPRRNEIFAHLMGHLRPRPFGMGAARAAPMLWLGVLLALYLSAACSGPGIDPGSVPRPGETRTFEGTWSASGSRSTLSLEHDRKASIFNLTGSVLLTGGRGLGVGFQGDAIGFSDSVAGGTGQCVWTDERGDKVFSQLRGQSLGTGSRVFGTITGGTGRWAGLTGEYELHWQYVIETDEGAIS